MQPLVTKNDISQYARPCYADDDIVARCIDEAEMLDIKPVIGDALFMRLKTGVEYDKLMNGGSWKDKKGGVHVFLGLKATICYYVYARIVRAGNGIQTRFGYVEKRDEYSQGAELKTRMSAYDEAFSIADGFMREVLLYMVNNRDIFPDLPSRIVVRNNRNKFKVIGE